MSSESEDHVRVERSANLEYVLRVPEGDSPSGGWPLLCFLHGYDEAAPREIRQGLTRHGPLAPTAAAIAAEQFVVVAPQLPIAGDRWREHGAEVLQIVQRVSDECGADPLRLYLTGFSFGGNGVFDLALEAPRSWTALWSVDPTRIPQDSGHPVWLSVGEIARRRIPAYVRALELKARADEQPPGDRVILDEREDHVGSARRAYADSRIYEWLLRRVKSEG